MRILVVDVGETHLKILATDQDAFRNDPGRMAIRVAPRCVWPEGEIRNGA
jgi:hypothetical protein